MSVIGAGHAAAAAETSSSSEDVEDLAQKFLNKVRVLEKSLEEKSIIN